MWTEGSFLLVFYHKGIYILWKAVTAAPRSAAAAFLPMPMPCDSFTLTVCAFKKRTFRQIYYDNKPSLCVLKPFRPHTMCIQALPSTYCMYDIRMSYSIYRL